MIRINIDLKRCEGHGRCSALAPELFGYDDVTSQAFMIEEANLDAHRDKIMEAIEACPEAAISLAEASNSVEQ